MPRWPDEPNEPNEPKAVTSVNPEKPTAENKLDSTVQRSLQYGMSPV